MSTDSESGIEEEEKACEAVRVGVVVGAAMRPLVSDRCTDASAPTPTTLLDEDAKVSDVKINSQ